MEIRARYILMGIFLVAAIGGVFAFIFWLENAGSLRNRATYQISFDGPVSGLYSGSSVLFNGLRVGEVTALRIAAERPDKVAAVIAIDENTPIRQDTIVDLEYQGLTGVAAVSLTGGQSDAPLVEASDGVLVLEARHGAGLTVTQSARDALLKLHAILDDNSQPLKELIGNINDFSGALARNSDKVDGILAGLERMTGGSRSPDTEKVFDLAAIDKSDAAPKTLRGPMTVPLPSALFQLDTQNILFRATPDAAPLPPGARWADNLTRLLQMKLVQSFENAGYLGSVGHSDAITGEYQLLIDVRRFQMVTEPESRADIAFSAKIADTDGKVLGAKIFESTANAASEKIEASVAALNEAFKEAAADLVDWASRELEATAAPETREKTEADPAADAAPAPAAAAAPASAGEDAGAAEQPDIAENKGELAAPEESAPASAASEAEAPQPASEQPEPSTQSLAQDPAAIQPREVPAPGAEQPDAAGASEANSQDAAARSTDTAASTPVQQPAAVQ